MYTDGKISYKWPKSIVCLPNASRQQAPVSKLYLFEELLLIALQLLYEMHYTEVG